MERRIAGLCLGACLGACAVGADDAATPDARDVPPAEDAAGEASDAECPPGYSRCGTACVDLNSNPGHCGACDRACPPEDVCNEGRCSSGCAGGLTDCSGACVDLQTDEAHCGGCGLACGPTEGCVGGGCVCVPDCWARECGSDGCGGSCGTCPGGAGCRADGTCECLPSCTGRECGSDGCSGTCPPGCSGGWICGGAGLCQCSGTPCGTACCYVGQVCAGSSCCTPACAGRECGSDGCGGSCGSCDPGWSCGGTGRCAFDGLTFEAEAAGMGHLVGRAEADGWSANTAADGPGHMLYGPYTDDVPSGSRSAAFRMMVDNNSADSLVVVTLDVFDATAVRVLGERRVRRTEFTGTMSYQDFAVSFTAPGGANELEFRVYWNDYSYVRIDRVTVR